MKWVTCLEEGSDHRAHALIVLAENSLEDGEVELSHLESNFVKDVNVFCS